jgi:hypothetical protein
MKRLLFILLVCFVSLPQSGRSQEISPTAKPPKSNDKWLDIPCKLALEDATFADFLKTLQASNQLSFIADGTPNKKTASIASESTLRVALSKVAETFDYTFRVGKNRTILLTKRFKEEREEPQFHLLEMREVAGDVVRLFKTLPFDESGNWEHSVDALYQTLTPQQMEWLQMAQPLTGKQLTQQQRSLLQQAVYTNLLAQTYGVWHDLSTVLAGLPQSKLAGEEPLAGRSDLLNEVRYQLVPPVAVKSLNMALNPIQFGRKKAPR